MIAQFILSITGAGLIWAACNVKRKKESRIEIGSKWWWLQVVLIVFGMMLYYLGINCI